MKKNAFKFKNFNIKPVFSDSRGEILDILEEKVSHIGMITFKQGAVRGNHYHKSSTQYSYVLNGRIQLFISDINSKYKRKIILREGALTIISPKIIHTYKALTDAKILDMTTFDRKGRGYEKDTFRILQK